MKIWSIYLYVQDSSLTLLMPLLFMCLSKSFMCLTETQEAALMCSSWQPYVSVCRFLSKAPVVVDAHMTPVWTNHKSSITRVMSNLTVCFSTPGFHTRTVYFLWQPRHPCAAKQNLTGKVNIPGEHKRCSLRMWCIWGLLFVSVWAHRGDWTREMAFSSYLFWTEECFIVSKNQEFTKKKSRSCLRQALSFKLFKLYMLIWSTAALKVLCSVHKVSRPKPPLSWLFILSLFLFLVFVVMIVV